MIKRKMLPNNSVPMMTAVVFTSALLLAACNENKPPAVAPATPELEKVSALQPKPVQNQASSVARLAPPPVNQFDFSSKKDPFKPFMDLKTDKKIGSNKNMLNMLPIHSFDVSQFKLIGIITGSRENSAMVTDPGGKGYVLKVGMTIGKNNGRIVSINTNGVDVLEQFKDDNGRVRKETIKLTLPRKQ